MKSGKYPDWMLRAIIKAGGHVGKNPFLFQSESNRRSAKLAILRANAKCEVEKARATIRGLLAAAMVRKSRK